MTQRTYPLPGKLQAAVGVDRVTLDQIELLTASSFTDVSTWAMRTMLRENRIVLDRVLTGTDLPRGLVARGKEADLAIEALVAECGAWSKKSQKWDRPWDDDEYEGVPFVPQEVQDQLESHEAYDADLSYDEDDWDALSYGEYDPGICPVCHEPQYEEVCPECGRHHPSGQMTIELTEDDVAAIARAFMEGADVVLLRPYAPIATTQFGMTSAGESANVELPENSVAIAVVDELDTSAVLELLAVAPGPKVYQRDESSWKESGEWKSKLASVDPPPVVELTPEMLASVIAQIDAAANKSDDTGGDEDQPEQPPIEASAATEYADDVGLAFTLLAASKAKNKLKNKAAGAERLRQYWGYGEGAAKIRWGTKGDWTRCVKQLSKYLGPRAKGYCNLMHARVTGAWPNSKGVKKLPNPAVSAEAIAKQLSR